MTVDELAAWREGRAISPRAEGVDAFGRVEIEYHRRDEHAVDGASNRTWIPRTGIVRVRRDADVVVFGRSALAGSAKSSKRRAATDPRRAIQPEQAHEMMACGDDGSQVLGRSSARARAQSDRGTRTLDLVVVQSDVARSLTASSTVPCASGATTTLSRPTPPHHRRARETRRLLRASD